MLDASLLLMPLVHFIAPTDPRWLSTLDAIGNELVSDSLVYRYDPVAAPDGLDGEEGTFSMCSFWYVECLARAGYLDEAQLAFEKMLTYANHLRPLLRADRDKRRAAGKLSPSVHSPALISAAIRLDYELRSHTPPTPAPPQMRTRNRRSFAGCTSRNLLEPRQLGSHHAPTTEDAPLGRRGASGVTTGRRDP